MAVVPTVLPVTISQIAANQGVNTLTNTQSSLNNPAQGGSFGQFLNQAIQQLDNTQQTADTASIGLATGQVQDFHTAAIALEKANLSMQLAVQVRDKVIDAYNQIMQMQM